MISVNTGNGGIVTAIIPVTAVATDARGSAYSV
jgi:hypothetical protein